MTKGPSIPDINAFLALGINPKTHLPIKLGTADCVLKENMKKILRIVDEQDAVNRYVWYNLPGSITSQELERLIYYRGNICMFFNELDGEFYFMPYALHGGIDFYGRYKTIHPVPFYGGSTDEEKSQIDRHRNYLSTLSLKVQYDIKLDELTEEDFVKSAVILRDYTQQQSQTIVSRQILQEPLLDVMSNIIPYLNTSLKNSTGVQGMRVSNTDEVSNVEAANVSLEVAALNGRKFVPMTGATEFQQLTGDGVLKSEEFLIALQSLDNFRLSLYGLDNGGLFQKKSHMLEAEQELNAGNVGLIAQDGLSQRQNFCNIANSIWGTEMWCEMSETALGIDKNNDGEASDDGVNMGEQPDETKGGQNE